VTVTTAAEGDGALRPRRLATAAWSAAVGIASGALLLLVTVPLAGLLFTTSPRALVDGLTNPLVGPALRLSLITTTSSLLLVVLCGTPLAWVLARRRSRLARLIETVTQLPVVLPPAVAGVALLLAFGRRGLLGPTLGALGVGVPFTTAAVVLAESFVAAPFYVQAAVTAFRALDPDLVLVARALGASRPRVFLSVAVPISAPALAGGAAMSWARALGEFGATLMFAGNLTGRTQTLPLAVYTALESDLAAAQALSIILVVVAFALLVAVRAGTRT
jgi:molybdate transport system permease protein